MSKWRLTRELTVQGARSRRSSIQRRLEPLPCPGTSAPNAVDAVCAVESVDRIAALQAIGASPYACQSVDASCWQASSGRDRMMAITLIGMLHATRRRKGKSSAITLRKSLSAHS